MAGGEVEPDAFENPTEDFEVCFVAGTQVLLADGSTKPIEQIRPGDKVLSSHYLTPEETPTSANVVRFFDNGEKEVVRLRFAAHETPIDATSQLAHDAATSQEIVCTPGHRFYVVGKGWVRAQDLQPGDLALSATGEKIAFVSRENLAEKRRVYNFEVEGKHTYFVRRGQYFVLAHNDCSYCGSDDWGRLCFRNGAVYYCGWFNTEVRIGTLEIVNGIPFVNRDGIIVSAIKIQANVNSWRTPTSPGDWSNFFQKFKSTRDPSSAIELLRDRDFLASIGFETINQEALARLAEYQATLSELPQEAVEYAIEYALNFAPTGRVEDFLTATSSVAATIRNKLILHCHNVPVCGQWRHPISKKGLNELKKTNVRKALLEKSSKLITRAVESETHRGDQDWRRMYDDNLIKWIIKEKDELTDEKFIDHLIDIYSKDDLKDRFPYFIDELEEWKKTLY